LERIAAEDGEELRRRRLGVVELEGFVRRGSSSVICALDSRASFSWSQLVARRDPDHVAVLAHVQAAG